MKSTFRSRVNSRTPARYPAGGTTTPASPWIGSNSTATVFSLIAARIAVRSPYGTISKPGVYGPKSARASRSVEKLTIVVVRPWKLLPATTIFARPAGTPLT